jgi:hypothetical protein
MRKALLTTFLLLAAKFFAQAQLSKGDFIVDFSFSYKENRSTTGVPSNFYALDSKILGFATQLARICNACVSSPSIV